MIKVGWCDLYLTSLGSLNPSVPVQLVAKQLLGEEARLADLLQGNALYLRDKVQIITYH